jgi:hypothetical protein
MINIVRIATMMLVCLSGCSLQQPTTGEKFAQQALRTVRNSMKDPTSVKFKDVTVIERGRCAYGQVLGKNSYGAYAGYQGFTYNDGEVTFEEPGGLSNPMNNRESAVKYMDKQSDCSTLMGSTLSKFIIHIPEA